jgi:translation elongation factor P/translation initiation factor 5A
MKQHFYSYLKATLSIQQEQKHTMYQPDQFVKLTNPDGINREFQHKEGLNEDIYELNRNEECAKGGLYFCQYKDIGEWIGNYGDALIWKVEIPEGEEVIEYRAKLKAKRIILSEPKKAYEDCKIRKLAVQHNGWALQFVKEQTEELCKLAVQQNGLALQFVKEKTAELCKLAVQQNGWALQFVKEQTEEMCKLAVKQNGWDLQYVKEQTEELCKLAVKQNVLALQFVNEQTEEICKLAVQRDGWALQYVKEQTEEICKLAVQQNVKALNFVKPEFRYLF